jgi:hypothetical protein
MGRFLSLLIIAILLGVLGAYVVLDDPVKSAQAAWSQTFSPPRLEDVDDPRAMLPSVTVYFVDKKLATREGRQLAVIAEDWHYCYDPTGEVFQVPRLFETDFASIPGWAQFYIRPDDPHIVGAAIVHDWLYAVGGRPGIENKRKADEIFRFALREKGVNFIKRNIMFQAVSGFGSSFSDAAEMRFRDLRNGEILQAQQWDKAVVVDKLPGCAGFLDKYWGQESSDEMVPLSPNLLAKWIQLP